MKKDFKYLVGGLLIGAGIVLGSAFVFWIFTRAPARTPERTLPTDAPPPTATWTPLPTSTHEATVTPLPPSSTPLPTATLTSTPIPDSALAAQIADILPSYGGDWNILIRADGTSDMVDLNGDRFNHVASIIKLPIAMLFFKSLEEQGIAPADYDSYLNTRGVGRTYMQLLKAMLVESEEEATGTLKEAIYDSKVDYTAYLKEWGAPRTQIGDRHSTPRDIASLYESLYFGRAITPEGRAIILKLLSAYTPNDDTRFGILRPMLPTGAEFYNKRGSVVEDRLIIGDSALVAWNENGTQKVYVLVALAYNGDIPTTDVKLVKGLEAIANLFWDFVGVK